MIIIDKPPYKTIPNITEKHMYKSFIILELPYHVAFLTKQKDGNTLWLNWFGRDIRYGEEGSIWGWRANTNLITFLIRCWSRWETNEYNGDNIIKIYVCENINEVYSIINDLSRKLTDTFREIIVANAEEVFHDNH
jgi:hypothetical protein